MFHLKRAFRKIDTNHIKGCVEIGPYKGPYKGWELTFFVRAFGWSEKRSINVGFGFSDKGLKSQNLQFRTNKKYVFFNVISILSTYYTMLTQSMWFFMWKRQLTHSIVWFFLDKQKALIRIVSSEPFAHGL